MPVKDGISALQDIQKSPKIASIPVVFMTAKAMEQEISTYQEMGVVDVITKPFDPKTLPDTINKIWNNLP